MTRFSIDLIDLFIVELGTALNLNLQPIRLSLCNSHTQEYLQKVPFREYVESSNKQVLLTMAALISGSLRFRESLEQRMDASYHLNMLNDTHNELNKNGNKSTNSKQQHTDSGLINLRNKKFLNNFLESYLTKNSFGLLSDPNFALVNMIRNYLYFYSSEFYADMACANKPDENSLKNAINQVFNTWSSVILGALEKKSHMFKLAGAHMFICLG